MEKTLKKSLRRKPRMSKDQPEERYSMTVTLTNGHAIKAEDVSTDLWETDPGRLDIMCGAEGLQKYSIPWAQILFVEYQFNEETN